MKFAGRHRPVWRFELELLEELALIGNPATLKMGYEFDSLS
jgi:hypothetical protein